MVASGGRGRPWLGCAKCCSRAGLIIAGQTSALRHLWWGLVYKRALLSRLPRCELQHSDISVRGPEHRGLSFVGVEGVGCPSVGSIGEVWSHENKRPPRTPGPRPSRNAKRLKRPQSRSPQAGLALKPRCQSVGLSKRQRARQHSPPPTNAAMRSLTGNEESPSRATREACCFPPRRRASLVRTHHMPSNEFHAKRIHARLGLAPPAWHHERASESINQASA